MGMTIEEAMHHLNTWSTTHGSGQTTDKQHEEAKKIAKETMRKYQKIEQILDDCLLDDWEILKSIREVLEDGNNNQHN